MGKHTITSYSRYDTHRIQRQIATSTDGGATWPGTIGKRLVGSSYHGVADHMQAAQVMSTAAKYVLRPPRPSELIHAAFQIAISANGTSILWSSGNAGPLISTSGSSFTSVPSLPSGSVIASDKKNNSVFYAASGSKFYLSTNDGQSFTAVGTLGSSTSPVKIVVNPNVTGDVWVSSDKGLFHSTNSGTTFTTISGVTQVRVFDNTPRKDYYVTDLYSTRSHTGLGYSARSSSDRQRHSSSLRCGKPPRYRRRNRLFQI